MNIRNRQAFTIPVDIPSLLIGKVSVFTNCQLETHEIVLFNKILKCVENHLIADNIDLSLLYTLNVFFVGNNEITFFEDKNKTYANQFHVATYQMDKLRSLNSEIVMAIMFTEELTHYYWRIFDETTVKYKVVEILNDIYPKLTIEHLRRLGMNGL